MKLTKKNKKFIIIGLVAVAVICAVVAIIISQATKLTNESYANCAVGDINGDGFINTEDALIIEKFSKSDIELFETQQKNADVNLDGKIDRTDAEWILKYTTGLIRKLPVTGDGDVNAPISNNDKLIRHKSADAETTVKVVNSWSNGDGTYSYQLNISVRNLKDSRLKGWKTTIVADDMLEKSKSWDCECVVKDKTIVIEGEAIPTETVGVCGVIVKSAEDLAFESVTTES
ncbi:MAG: dockerin type I repeat-containing protein [Clostridia bacterium]|nr:dockerin type I repeat-containing protein [Clostridia bacterium]